MRQRQSPRTGSAPRCSSAGLPTSNPAAAHALGCFGGDRLVYVGDERFTGDAAFHELLSRDWQLQRRLLLPSWPGIEDSARLYVRRSSL